MKHRTLGAIEVILGGAIVVSGLINVSPLGNGAYAQGQIAGLVFGFILCGVGLSYLIKGGKQSSPGK